MAHRLRSSQRSTIAALLVALSSHSTAASSPVSGMEKRVAFDLAGRVFEVGPGARQAFAAFGWDRLDFRRATLWSQSDSTWVLVGEFAWSGVQARARVELDAAELDSVRADVLRLLGSSGGTSAGARALLGFGTLAIGAGFHSWAIAGATNADNDAAAVTLSVAGSLLLTYIITDPKYVSWGDANLALYGGSRGIVWGALCRDLVAAERQGRVTPEGHYIGAGISEREHDERLGAAIAGSLTGEVGGFLWAHRARLTSGQARTMGVASDVGLLWGLAISEIADGDDGTGRDDKKRHNAIAGLAGAAFGFGAGHWAARRGSPTWGDAGAVRTAGLIGALAGLSCVDVDDSDEPWTADGDGVNAALGAMVAGSAWGLAVGHHVVRHRDIGVAQGILIDIMTIAGAATGIATTSLFAGDGDSRVYTGGATAGAVMGYALGLRATRFRGGDAAMRSLPTRWRWDTSGLVGLVAGDRSRAARSSWVSVARQF